LAGVLDDFLEKVRRAVFSDLYLIALAGALTVPDICGALEAPDGKARPKQYAAWYDANVVPGHGPTHMDGDTCYWFRCGFLHQGRVEHPKSPYNRILFAEPSPSAPMQQHMWEVEDALCIDVRFFCMDLIHAAHEWQERVRGTQPFETNRSRFISRHADGLTPYLSGHPVIG
jgi:hypothetical protein